jgi:hypothetical protein
MNFIDASASRSRPWVSSQRGLSGRLRRMNRITTASIGPTRKPTRQPVSVDSELSSRNAASVPMIEPSQ